MRLPQPRPQKCLVRRRWPKFNQNEAVMSTAVRKNREEKELLINMASKEKSRPLQNRRAKRANHGVKPGKGLPRSQFKRARR